MFVDKSTDFRLRFDCSSNTRLPMSDSALPPSSPEHFHLENLSEEVLAELSERAQRNARTVHEEAEHAIKQHLRTFDRNED